MLKILPLFVQWTLWGGVYVYINLVTILKNCALCCVCYSSASKGGYKRILDVVKYEELVFRLNDH